MTGLLSPGVPGVPWYPQNLPDQLTLYQPGPLQVGGRLCSPNNTGIPGFSDLPTALSKISSMYISRSEIQNYLNEIK